MNYPLPLLIRRVMGHTLTNPSGVTRPKVPANKCAYPANHSGPRPGVNPLTLARYQQWKRYSQCSRSSLRIKRPAQNMHTEHNA